MPITFYQKIQAAKDLIKEYLAKYPKSAVAVSFGKDSVALLHLIREINPNIPVIAVLADTEFPETLALRDKLVKEWKLNYKEYNFVNNGDPKDCCRSLKVEKFKEALKDYDCWFSGIRKDEGTSRTDFQEVEERGGLVKVNPVLNFTEKDIWRYIAIKGAPVNPMYEKYRSLSCQKCSAQEEDETLSERAGRWKGTACEGGECGIHTQSLR
ncbi:MAG: phosphoadenosine phosphosulfate reductase family protein [Candidatus Nealsonbacteria bacterium]|nr:phosphoadenosine phosphosulfate reductase family protein [Candidatus Nealsonbacteria bacterium]